MAMNLKGVNKPRTSNNNRGSENIAVMIADVHVADASKKTANIAEDYAIAYLLEDGFGKTAEFGADGSPMTTVKFKMRAPKTPNPDPKKTPLGVFDLQIGKRKGQSPAMGKFPTVVLENSYIDRDGVVSVGWLSVSQRSFDSPNDRTLPRVMALVESERYNINEKNERVYRQVRYAAMPDMAQTFHDLESFKAAAAAFLVENPEAGGGRPGVFVRFLNNESVVDPKAETEIGQLELTLGWDSENGKMLSAEASIDRWIADKLSPENPQQALWIENIKSSGSEPGYTSELIPFYRYNTGSQSLPSSRDKGMDDAENFRVPLEDREQNDAPVKRNNGDGFLMVSGFTPGSMIVKRVAEDGVFFATKTFAKNRFGPIYMKDELVTPNLPEDVKAAARGEAKKNALNSTRSAQQAPDTSADENEIPFGEPDHNPGLSMS